MYDFENAEVGSLWRLDGGGDKKATRYILDGVIAFDKFVDPFPRTKFSVTGEIPLSTRISRIDHRANIMKLSKAIGDMKPCYKVLFFDAHSGQPSVGWIDDKRTFLCMKKII